jgi:hypothetical protein
MNSRRFICWTDIQTPQGGGLAHAGILTCPTRSGAASGAPDARVGSKAEELALSICCPLSRRKRTSLGRFATSALCQKRRSIRLLIQCGAHSFCRPQASWCRSTRGDRNLYRLNGIPQRIGSRTRGQLSATQQNRLKLTLNETLSTSDCVPSNYQKINDISAIRPILNASLYRVRTCEEMIFFEPVGSLSMGQGGGNKHGDFG